MSQRDYAWLWLGASKTVVGGGGGATGSGGNVLLKTPPHKLDGPEHLTADDTTTLDASTTEHGLLPKLPGDATKALLGDGTWGAASAAFATPSIALATSASGGAASTVIRSDATIAAFDATVPVTQAFGDAAATGSAAFAARRDHKHGMPAEAAIRDAGRWEPLVDDGTDTIIIDSGTHTVVLDWHSGA
jgi:hypothetical protein